MGVHGLAAVLLKGQHSHYAPGSQQKNLGLSTVYLAFGVYDIQHEGGFYVSQNR